MRLARAYDWIYANTQKAFVVAALAGALARKPVVWHLRDMLTADHFSPANRRVAIALASRFAHHVIANSQATAQAFTDSGGRPDKTTVVHNGVDPAAFDTIRAEDIAQVRADTNARKDYVVAVFGRLTPWKGQHVVLDALEMLAQTPKPSAAQDRPVVLWIVGGALFTQEDRDYQAKLKQRVAESALATRVTFMGFCDNVPALMKACDVVVHASIQPEPFGRVLVEGMLAGRPVVASAAGGALEILQHGVTGYLTPPGDAAALAQTLQVLRSDPLTAEQVAHAGKRTAHERFTRDAMIHGVTAVLGA